MEIQVSTKCSCLLGAGLMQINNQFFLRENAGKRLVDCRCFLQENAPFNAADVARRVYSARKSADTQRQEIFKMMTSYNAQQRTAISDAYASQFDQVAPMVGSFNMRFLKIFHGLWFYVT